MIIALCQVDGKYDRDFGIKAPLAGRREVPSSVEYDPMNALSEWVRGEFADPAISVGDRSVHYAIGGDQGDLDALGRSAEGGIENVGADTAHVPLTILVNRNRLIRPSSRRSTARSASGLLSSLSRNTRNNSSAERPAAHTKYT